MEPESPSPYPQQIILLHYDICFRFFFVSYHFTLLLLSKTIISKFANVCLFVCFLAQQPPSGPGPPHSRGFWITQNNAPQSLGLLCKSDQLVAETYTWQNTTLTTNIHAPCGIWFLKKAFIGPFIWLHYALGLEKYNSCSGFEIVLRYVTGGRGLRQWECACLLYSRLAWFEPTTPAGERPQTADRLRPRGHWDRQVRQ